MAMIPMEQDQTTQFGGDVSSSGSGAGLISDSHIKTLPRESVSITVTTS